MKCHNTIMPERRLPKPETECSLGNTVESLISSQSIGIGKLSENRGGSRPLAKLGRVSKVMLEEFQALKQHRKVQ